jgi:hypothetical protein
MYNCALWQQPWLGCLCCQRGPEHCMRLQIVTPVTRTGQMRRRHKRARAWRHASAWLGRTRCPLRRRWQRWQACCSRAAQLRTLPGLRCMPVHQARLRTCMQGAAVPAALPCSCCFCLLLNGLGGGRGGINAPSEGHAWPFSCKVSCLPCGQSHLQCSESQLRKKGNWCCSM